MIQGLPVTGTGLCSVEQPSIKGFHSIFEHAAAGMSIALTDGRLLQANPAFCQFLGYSRSELVNRTVFDITYPADLDRTRELFLAAAAGESSASNYEKRYLRKNGSMVWGLTTVVWVRDEAGRPSYCVALTQDITRQKASEQALRESEELYRCLVENIDLGITLIGEDRRILKANTASGRMFAKPAESLTGVECFREFEKRALVCPHCPGTLSLATGQPAMVVTEGVRDDGSRLVARIQTFPVWDVDGRARKFVEVIEDITDRKQTEDALRESERRYRDMLSNVELISMMLDRDARITFCNDYLLRLTGWRREEVLGANWFELFVAPEDVHLRDTFAQVLENLPSAWHHENEILTRSGERRLIRWNNSVLCSATGEVIGAASIGEDISERKRYEEHLQHLATHDELTGLANRTLLLDRLGQSLHYAHRSGRLVAVLLLDLDRFQVINDSLGHEFGDRVLCAVAQRLQQNVREADTVARVGGDEFVIVLAEVAEPADVGVVAAKILGNLARPLSIGGREITVTASLGISLSPRDSDNGATLVRYADLAMYRAKRNDRSHFAFYAPEMNQRLLETLELESALRQALEREEFCLHYQPKVDLASGRIIGCEALLRWRHPQRGLVSPGDFIPLAEETGLIVPLGRWVLKEACRQAKAWQDEGLPELTVAVNLSARQFRKGELPQLIAELLHEIGLEPRLLELELTESMVMDDPAGAERTLHTLKELGVGLSLDDFGTGYSSLNCLRRFPVDSLKIDRSFIRDVATDPSGASVVTTIIDIAHNLSLTAVAEGVETQEQLSFLSRSGCDMYQGFLLSKPLPPEGFTKLLKGQ
ncbi:MAG: EAL domain-containing protein [Desulfuromonadales bacterium]|nr:EAL domain-containing protein [Desulfuromonadales bacterium]